MYLSEDIQNKWAPVLDCDSVGAIKDTHRRSVTALVLENTEKALREDAAHGNYQTLTEANPAATNIMGASSSTPSDGAVDIFDPVLISLVRRAMPNLVAYDICAVNPMPRPTGLFFALRSRSSTQPGQEPFTNPDNTTSATATN